jgi:hypothetical protein
MSMYCSGLIRRRFGDSGCLYLEDDVAYADLYSRGPNTGNNVPSAILSEVSLRVIVGIISWLSQDWFLPNPFQFIINLPSFTTQFSYWQHYKTSHKNMKRLTKPDKLLGLLKRQFYWLRLSGIKDCINVRRNGKKLVEPFSSTIHQSGLYPHCDVITLVVT